MGLAHPLHPTSNTNLPQIFHQSQRDEAPVIDVMEAVYLRHEAIR